MKRISQIYKSNDLINQLKFLKIMVLIFYSKIRQIHRRVLLFPSSYGNMVRLGGILYGLGDDILPDWVERPALKSVLSLFSKIALIKNVKKGETLGYSRTVRMNRDSVIATIPIGYQDGYRRALSNCGRVIINGKFADVVGRISMDWTMLDVTEIRDVKLDDEVILIGEQNDLKSIGRRISRKNRNNFL